MAELCNRLKKAGIGVKLRSMIINHILFADDIALLGVSEEDLQTLERILQQRCYDLSMSVSPIKTQVVGPLVGDEWVIEDYLMNIETPIKSVAFYRYLGVDQFATSLKTINNYVRVIDLKAERFRRVMNLSRYIAPDSVQAYLAQWQNVLLPSLLYGADAIPLDQNDLLFVEREQCKVGKAIMGVSPSTAHATVPLMIGLKPITQLVASAKSKFIIRLMSKKEMLLSSYNLNIDNLDAACVQLIDSHVKKNNNARSYDEDFIEISTDPKSMVEESVLVTKYISIKNYGSFCGYECGTG